MTKPEFTIEAESPSDTDAIAALCARAFGPGRFARTAYRVRENIPPAQGLSFVAKCGPALAGSIRFTEINVGDTDRVLLLGPLAVEPEFAGQGCGRKLVSHGIDTARALDYRLVLLVGDVSYYGALGFVQVPPRQISFPGPVDPARILAYELHEGALEEANGALRPPRSAGKQVC